MLKQCSVKLTIIHDDYNKTKENISVHNRILHRLKNNMIIKINNWKSWNQKKIRHSL